MLPGTTQTRRKPPLPHGEDALSLQDLCRSYCLRQRSSRRDAGFARVREHGSAPPLGACEQRAGRRRKPGASAGCRELPVCLLPDRARPAPGGAGRFLDCPASYHLAGHGYPVRRSSYAGEAGYVPSMSVYTSAHSDRPPGCPRTAHSAVAALSWRSQALPVRDRGSLGTAASTQLGQDVRDVHAGGLSGMNSSAPISLLLCPAASRGRTSSSLAVRAASGPRPPAPDQAVPPGWPGKRIDDCLPRDRVVISVGAAPFGLGPWRASHGLRRRARILACAGQPRRRGQFPPGSGPSP